MGVKSWEKSSRFTTSPGSISLGGATCKIYVGSGHFVCFNGAEDKSKTLHAIRVPVINLDVSRHVDAPLAGVECQALAVCGVVRAYVLLS